MAADRNGNLFGLMIGGGAYAGSGFYRGGTVFMMQRVGRVWQEQTILSFNPIPGQLIPSLGSNVVADPTGHLFACLSGGSYGEGGIIKLSPPAASNGVWRGLTLAEFGIRSNDPYVYESCAITLDPSTGVIVGVSDRGGRSDLGTLFTLTPPAPGTSNWSYKVVHDFIGAKRDGSYPEAAPLQIGNTFYGSAGYIIWSYTP